MHRPFFAALLALAASFAHAGEVQVAVAANFAGPLAKIGEAFTAATGHALKVSAGATGKFYAQIIAGAPFEVLIAADDETPKKLVAEGHAVAGSNFTYAIGKLVLWSAQPGFVDDQGAVLALRQVRAPRHRQPQGRALRRGGDGGDEGARADRRADAQAGHGREHRAGLPVRRHRQCRARLRRAVAGGGAGQAGDRLVLAGAVRACTARSARTRCCSRPARRTRPPRRCSPT